MQHRRGVEVLDGEWYSNSCPCRFTPRKISGAYCTESWLEHKAGRVRNREEKSSCSHYTPKADLPTCIESLHRLRYPGTYPAPVSPRKCGNSPDKFLIFLRLPIRIVSWKFSTDFCPSHHEQNVVQCVKNQVGIDTW